MSDGIKFKPIYGPSDLVGIQDKEAGQLFFETDTGKIYLDIDNQNRKLMGGSSSGASLYYTSQGGENNKIDKDEEFEQYYVLLAESLQVDSETVLHENDLILGADGAFYRIVRQKDNGDYLCIRMAISGSGGGGPIVPDDLELVKSASWKGSQTFIYGQDYYLEIGAHSTVDDEINLEFLVTQNDVQVESFTVTIANDTYYQFNTKRLPKGSGIKIKVQASSLNSKMSEGPWNTIQSLTVVELAISKSRNFNTAVIAEGDLGLVFIPKSNGLYQRLHVIIDGAELDLNSIQQDRVFLSFQPTNSDTTVIIPAQAHGIHNIELYTTVEISENTLKSDSLFYEIA